MVAAPIICSVGAKLAVTLRMERKNCYANSLVRACVCIYIYICTFESKLLFSYTASIVCSQTCGKAPLNATHKAVVVIAAG